METARRYEAPATPKQAAAPQRQLRGLVSLKYAISVVLACTTRYRLPEPQRRADRRTKSP